MATIKVFLWNVQWQHAGTAAGAVIRRLIAASDPDLVCLTEACVDLVSADGTITSEADFGGPKKDDRRKVVLWSRWGWASSDRFGDPALPPGRFVCGRTQSPHGLIDVHGICIPWDGAHVKMGRKDSRLWQEHARYLDGLERVLSRSPDHARSIVVGDFNQSIPRTRAPRVVHEQLQSLLDPNFQVATSGAIEGMRALSIDHLAHGNAITAVSVAPLPNENGLGRRISDHVGLLITLSM